MSQVPFTIRPVEGGADLLEVAALRREYAAALAIDPACQGFAKELAGLPAGTLFMAPGLA